MYRGKKYLPFLEVFHPNSIDLSHWMMLDTVSEHTEHLGQEGFSNNWRLYDALPQKSHCRVCVACGGTICWFYDFWLPAHSAQALSGHPVIFPQQLSDRIFASVSCNVLQLSLVAFLSARTEQRQMVFSGEALMLPLGFVYTQPPWYIDSFLTSLQGLKTQLLKSGSFRSLVHSLINLY